MLFLCIIIFRVYAYANESLWKQSAADYVKCILINKPAKALAGIQISCGAENDSKPFESPNVDFWYMMTTAIYGQGRKTK
jgi:hypothetical protein